MRVWSLIISIFGDIVMDRGTIATPEPVWIAPLLDLLALLDIDAGLARTNFSRLVANGTLIRDKTGRNTFYRLSAGSREDFMRASDIIYARHSTKTTSLFQLALIDRCVNRPKARQAIEARGYRFISATTAVLPLQSGDAPAPLPDGAIMATAPVSDALIPAIREAWQISQLAEGYRWFVETFAPAAQASPETPAAAITMRLQLVHHFRRLILRDPGLESSALPADWRGTEARRIFDRAYGLTLEKSTTWLEAAGLRP
jgi:phenylacetic acid degradation operon negative regulatory protein